MDKFLNRMGNEKEPAVSDYKNEGFESPYRKPFANGTIIAATDKALSSLNRNEDRILIVPSTKSFAVIDGMGGYGNGNVMADILANELLKEMKEPFSVEGLNQSLIRASAKMNPASGFLKGGAAYTLCYYDKRRLCVASAGDVFLKILSPQGVEVGGIITGNLVDSPTTRGPGKPQIEIFDFPNGNYAILGSDGFWNNITEEELRDIIRRGDKVFERLQIVALEKMKGADGDKDNISLVVFSN